MQNLGGNRDGKVGHGADPEPGAGPGSLDLPVFVHELPLQGSAVFLAEAGRVEPEEPAVDAVRVRHVSPHAGSGNPRLSSASRTNCRSRTASACATRRPSAVIR